MPIITPDGRVLRNLEEQVQQNKCDIERLDYEKLGSLNDGLGTDYNAQSNKVDIKVDSEAGGLSFNADDELQIDFSEVQHKLTAGQNITISADNVISARGGGGGGDYTAGDGINISEDDTISVRVDTDQGALIFNDYGDLAINTEQGGIQEKLTAGDGINISSGNAISIDRTNVSPVLDSSTTTTIRNSGTAGHKKVDVQRATKSALKVVELDPSQPTVLPGLSVNYDDSTIKVNSDGQLYAVGGGGGAVDSVNGKTGTVVLDATDLKVTTNQQTVQNNIIRIDETLDAKLDANKGAVAAVGGLVVPTAAPTESVLIGVTSDREQLLVEIGDNLTLSDDGVLSATGGGGGEPAAYLKSAQVSNNTLTLTKKDNTTVVFEPDTVTVVWHDDD